MYNHFDWLYSPLNTGDMVQTPMQPLLVNCPKPNSMTNNGRPATSNIIQYGIKNAPDGKNKTFSIRIDGDILKSYLPFKSDKSF